MGKCTIVMFSHSFGDIVVANKKYAKKWGYSFALWKPYDADSEAVLWLPEDALIIDHDSPLEPLIALADGAQILVGREGFFGQGGVILTRGISTSASAVEKLAQQASQIDQDLARVLKPGQGPLENGYPIRVGDICVVNDDVLGSRRSSYILYPAKEDVEDALKSPCAGKKRRLFPWNMEKVSFVEKNIPPVVIPKVKSVIPRIIHQTFETVAVPKDIAERCIASWDPRSPSGHTASYKYRYHTGHDCRREIEEAIAEGRLEEAVLKAYDALYPGAFKADLWRYCCLYLEGGVYADVKFVLRVPLDELIEPHDDLVLTVDEIRVTPALPSLYNGFVAAPKGCPLMKAAIDLCVSNIEKRAYGRSPIDITGPQAFGRALYPILGWPLQGFRPPKGVTSNNIRIFYYDGPITPSILDERDVVVIDTRPRGINSANLNKIFQEAVGRAHYDGLWKAGRAFVDGAPRFVVSNNDNGVWMIVILLGLLIAAFVIHQSISSRRRM